MKTFQLLRVKALCNRAGKLLAVLAAVAFSAVVRVEAQSDPVCTGISQQANAMNITWSNGAPTFLLQRKLDLALDPNWVDVLTTPNSEAKVPLDAPTAFYRLQSEATNTVVAFGLLLNGASEVPVTASTATAVGTLSLQRSNLTYYINFSGLSGPATAAHIHAPGTPTNSAGVMIPLTVPAATSGVMSGTLTLTVDQLTNIVNGQSYINIHTTMNPGGEIRSQVVPLHVPISLDGNAETPAVATAATASGALTLIGSQLHYSITYSNLSGPGTAAHIHGPAGPGFPAGVLVPLNSPSGTNGTISGVVTLTPTQLTYLLEGLTYINIHSTVNPGGEIRGQIWPIQLTAALNQAPDGSGSAGTGSAFMTIVSNVLSYTVTFTNLTSNATAGHIHGPAFRGGNAGVIIPFSGVPSATSGTITGSTLLTPQQVYWLMSGQTYVNIHTINFPGGEIRDQLVPAN